MQIKQVVKILKIVLWYWQREIQLKHCNGGLSIIGRDYYGVFPLKGKLLNIREASIKQRNENDEINYLKQIIGLKMNTDYSIDENFNTLRYGKVMLNRSRCWW